MVFIESRAFTKRLADLAGAAAELVLSQIQSDLLADSNRGDLVPGLGGIRKARSPNPARSKGKRGGFRYLYLYIFHRQHIHLLFLLDKAEQEDATPQQKAILRRMVAEIKK